MLLVEKPQARCTPPPRIRIDLPFNELVLMRMPGWRPLSRRRIERCASCGHFGVSSLLAVTATSFCADCCDQGRPAVAGDPYDDVGGSG